MHVFSTFAVGGPEVRMASIINHFGRKYRHTVMAMDGRRACASRLVGDLDVSFLQLPAKNSGLLGNVTRFQAILRELRPDMLLTYNWGAIEWAFANRFFAQCRHVHLESGFGPEEADGQLLRRVLFRRVALARAERIVVPSRKLVDLAVRVWKLDANRILYIPNGVDCDRFARPPESGVIAGFEKVPGELIVGTLAPLRAVKNIPRLIHAFAGLVARFPTRLLILGDGPERPALSALVARMGLTERVVFAGHIEAPEKVLGWFDVFAISSDTEQLPNSLLQAMASGRPVAGVDVGDVKITVAPENRAFIVPKGDDAGLRNALERLLVEPATRRELGRANQACARAHYSQERMFATYAAVFDG